MEIRIVLPRFRWIVLISVIVGLLWSGAVSVRWPLGASLTDTGTGAGDPASTVEAKRTVDRERVRQAVLERREEILRYQLQLLEEEAKSGGATDALRIRDAQTNLLAILRERSASEALLLRSLEELWTAEGTTSTSEHLTSTTALFWPVAPRKGVSAGFRDVAYQKRFGFEHHAIDLPTDPGTVIHAPADGTVTHVAMNGMGYSYLVVRHAGDMETIYGHIRRALVAEGQSVAAGDALAESGGVPGEPGTGPYSTGPHLHFAVRVQGVLVDPLLYLVR